MGKRGKARTYVLIADLHYPEHDAAAWACVLDYIQHTGVDGVVMMGDMLDLSCVSHHTAGKGLFRPRGALKNNLDGFQRDVLDPLDAALGQDADKRFIIGNHEAWLTDQLAETAPELEGMIDLAGFLHLEDRGYEVISQGGHTRLGKLIVVHGDTVGGGLHHAKKAAEIYAGSSVVMGHHHTSQVFTRTSPVAAEDRWTATSLPCLCNLAPRYGRNRANSWLHGFGVVHVRPDGCFNLYPVVITVGQCTGPDGRMYGRKTAA